MSRRDWLLWLVVAVALQSSPLGGAAVKKDGAFWVLETSHYTIKTDASEEFAEDLADLMESLYTAYSKYAHGKPRVTGKSVVTVFRRQADFLRHIRGAGDNTAGVFVPATKELASFLEKQGEEGVFDVLKHEGFHQFFDKYVGQNRPVWLDEGLAGYFERTIKEGNEFKFGIVTKQDVALIQSAFKGEKAYFISARELMTMSQMVWNRNVEQRYEKARLQYLEARLLVQFLMSRREYTAMLDRYINACGQGADLEQGIRIAFGGKLEAMTKAWVEYMKAIKPYVPESCSVNLRYLATLLRVFGTYHKNIDSPAALLEVVKKNKDITWYIGEIGGGPEDKITQDDMETIVKWFRCPKEKKTVELPASYEFVKSQSKAGYPDITCKNHAPVLLRVMIVPAEEAGKTRAIVREEPLKKK